MVTLRIAGQTGFEVLRNVDSMFHLSKLQTKVVLSLGLIGAIALWHKLRLYLLRDGGFKSLRLPRLPKSCGTIQVRVCMDKPLGHGML